MLFVFSFLAGIFTTLSPCILPVLPAIMAAGISGGRLRPLGTIIGLICSFSFFTLTLTYLVQSTGISPSILRGAAIALIALFGLIMIFPKLSDWFSRAAHPIADLGQKLQGAKPSSGFWGGLIFGSALGLLWTPCAGPILGAITALAATQAVSSTAVLMTLSYSLGAGIPMLLLAYGSAKLVSSSRFLSRHSQGIRQFFGLLMLLFALILSLNWDTAINSGLSRYLPDIISEKDLPTEQELTRVIGGGGFREGEQAQELVDVTAWINSPPLTISQLKGKVVLVDFWTYSCINCLRTLPYLTGWYRDYKDKGLVIIGVHTPEFAFEKDPANVQKAVKDLGIEYPVALDNQYATWNAYRNRFWPAHYLIDQNGVLREVHFGEGGYVETENAIRKLLGLAPLEKEEPKQALRSTSPETYLGLLRGGSYQMAVIPRQIENYSYQGPLDSDRAGLKGPWLAEDEYIQAEGDDSILDFNFLATHVYLVMAGSSETPLEITLDGKAYGRIAIDGDKKYDIAAVDYGRHQLSLKVPKGVKAYAFTFGGE